MKIERYRFTSRDPKKEDTEERSDLPRWDIPGSCKTTGSLEPPEV